MYQTEFHCLSMSEAEEMIVEIWKCLEEYNLPTPYMTIDFLAPDAVSLRFEVEDPLWAMLLNQRMSSSAGASPHGALAYRSSSKETQIRKRLRTPQIAPFEMQVVAKLRQPKATRDAALPARRR